MGDEDLVDPRDRRVLLEHPQPLGILPTRWFWRAPENRRAIMLPYGLALFVIMLGLTAVDAPLLVAVAVTVAMLGLGLGTFERYIRREALRRRRACGSGSGVRTLRGDDGLGLEQPPSEPGDVCTSG